MTDGPDPELLARAEAGDAEAQNDVGRCYAADAFDPESARIAAIWFKRAADQGLPKAKHNLGVLAFQAGQEEEARRWFLQAAQDGWLNSVVALATLEEQEDLERALQLYEIAAKRGHAEAQDALARLAFDSNENSEVARHWSERAAEQGHSGAHTRLGTIYHEGLGVERDPQRAVFHWLTAAQAGHPGAQLMIGVAYDVGAGVPVDKVEAAYFLSLSAQQGNGPAPAVLGKLRQELAPEQIAAADTRLRAAGLPPLRGD
jgi:TPR repeat protein